MLSAGSYGISKQRHHGPILTHKAALEIGNTRRVLDVLHISRSYHVANTPVMMSVLDDLTINCTGMYNDLDQFRYFEIDLRWQHTSLMHAVLRDAQDNWP